MQRLKREIAKLKKYSFSNKDIKQFCNGEVNVFTYPDIGQYHDIEQLLHPYDACIILYLTTEHYGHWCALIKQTPDLIEFFDPYALMPDKEIAYIPKHFRKESGQNIPHLSRLLYQSDYKISYNHHRLQQLKNDVNTCGRHCCLRVVLKNMPLDEYASLFKKKDLSSDDIACLLTSVI